MLILTIRTDKPQSEIGLYEDSEKLAYKSWEAHRQLAETLHHEIANLLKSKGKDWRDIKGIVAYRGPGSYTGLRIGISVANALAAGLQIPIVGDMDEAWQQSGVQKLLDGQDDKQILPNYGAEAYVTQPRK